MHWRTKFYFWLFSYILISIFFLRCRVLLNHSTYPARHVRNRLVNQCCTPGAHFFDILLGHGAGLRGLFMVFN